MSSNLDIDALEMNTHLLHALQTFNLHVDPQLKVPSMRNYFMTKAKLAESLEDAYYSLKGLEMTKDLPYLSLEGTKI